MTAQPSLLLHADESFTIEEMTESYLRMTGVQEERLLARGIFELFPSSPGHPGAKGDCLRKSLEDALNSGMPQLLPARRYKYYNMENHLQELCLEIENVPVKDPCGEVFFILHTVREVSGEDVEWGAGAVHEACINEMETCSLPVGI